MPRPRRAGKPTAVTIAAIPGRASRRCCVSRRLRGRSGARAACDIIVDGDAMFPEAGP
jgi:hypothetical protein